MKYKKLIILALVVSFGFGIFWGIKFLLYVNIIDYNVKNIEQYYINYSLEYDMISECDSDNHYSKNEYIYYKYLECLDSLIHNNRTELSWIQYKGYSPNTSKIIISNPSDSISITHAMIHFTQHKESPLLFNLKYHYYRITKGYWDNLYEKEAYFNQINSIYFETRKKNAHKKY